MTNSRAILPQLKQIIKVDRICSVDEASHLDRLGADIISLSLSESHRFSDNRTVTENELNEIKEVVKYAKLCAQLSIHDFDIQSCVQLIQRYGLSYVQVSFPEIPSIDFRQKLQELGVGLIYSEIEASYEDDPSWILWRFEDVEDLNAAFFQIELLPSLGNSWESFKHECPKYPEELQIEDINKIASVHPCLISIDFNSDNILEILQRLNKICGIGLTLGTLASKQYLPHTLEFSQAIELVTILRSP